MIIISKLSNKFKYFYMLLYIPYMYITFLDSNFKNNHIWIVYFYILLYTVHLMIIISKMRIQIHILLHITVFTFQFLAPESHGTQWGWDVSSARPWGSWPGIQTLRHMRISTSWSAEQFPAWPRLLHEGYSSRRWSQPGQRSVHS